MFGFENPMSILANTFSSYHPVGSQRSIPKSFATDLLLPGLIATPPSLMSFAPPNVRLAQWANPTASEFPPMPEYSSLFISHSFNDEFHPTFVQQPPSSGHPQPPSIRSLTSELSQLSLNNQIAPIRRESDYNNYDQLPSLRELGLLDHGRGHRGHVQASQASLTPYLSLPCYSDMGNLNYTMENLSLRDNCDFPYYPHTNNQDTLRSHL